VHRQRTEHAQHDGGETNPDQVPPEGVVEHVEPDVEVELGILDAEVLPVGEEQPLRPAPLRGDAGEEADDAGQDADPEPEPGREQHPVPVKGLLLGRVWPQQRAHPVGQPEVEPDDEREQRAEDEEESHPGPQHRGEDPGVVDLGEP